MVCQGCGSPRTTARVFEFNALTVRQYKCLDCGVEFETVERFTEENDPMGSKITHGLDEKKPSINPVSRGFGGSSLSDPVSLFANPDSTSVKHEQVNGKSGRGKAKDYPEEFEKTWTGCKNPRGLKFKAYRAWIKSKPSHDLVIRVFLLWRETDGWRRGFEPHLSTWLNGRGWETEPTEGETRGPLSRATESVQQRDARAIRENAERTRVALAADVHATNAKLGAARVDPEKLPTREELAALRKATA